MVNDWLRATRSSKTQRFWFELPAQITIALSGLNYLKELRRLPRISFRMSAPLERGAVEWTIARVDS